MRSIILINKQRFKSNVGQYLQLSLSLLLSTFCISLALSLLVTVDKPFELLFERLKAPHMLLLFEDDKNLGNDISHWFSNQNEIEYVGAAAPFASVNKPFLYKGQKFDVDLQITERTVKDSLYDRVLVGKGAKKLQPDIGEIWLPYHFETTYNITLGDTLGIPCNNKFYNVRVSGFVIDPLYLSNIFNPSRAWVAPGSLSFFVPIQGLRKKTLGIRLKNSHQLDGLWGKFVSEFDYSGIDLKHTLFKSAFSSFSRLLSTVLLLFGAIMICVSLVILRKTITNSILSDFKQIGILKSVGFTKSNIIGSYLMQSILLLSVALPLGIIISGWAWYGIMQSTLKKIGITYLGLDLFQVHMVTACLVSLLVLGISGLSSLKAGKVKPLDAIRNIKHQYGNIHVGKYPSLESKFPILPWLSFRFIKGSVASSVSLVIGLLMTFTILLFAINLYTSFNHLGENKAAWGFDKSDLIVNRNSTIVLPLSHLDLMSILSNNKAFGIRQIIPFHTISASLVHVDNRKEQVFGKVYMDNMSKAGLLNLAGSHPKTANEIALCIGTAKNLGKSLGDTVTVEIDGYRNKFKVGGIYQDISSFGQGFRMHKNAYIALNPLFEPYSYGIELEGGITADSFERRLLMELGEAVSVETSIERRKSIIGLISNIKLAVLTITIIFSLICLLLISNEVVIQTKQNDLLYAQLKCIGFTSTQLRYMILLRILILFLISLLFGLPLGFLLVKPAANVLASSVSLEELPLAISWLSIGIAYSILFVFALLISWLSSRHIKRIDPRKLADV